jgi:hypothetical protein
VGGIIQDSEHARRTMEKWGPQLEMTLKRGPRAVRSLHRALMEADPDYREMMAVKRSDPPPLSLGEFTNGWRGSSRQ